MLKALSVVFFCYVVVVVVSAKKKKKAHTTEGGGSSNHILEALNGQCPQTCKDGHMPAPKARRRPFTNGCKVPQFDSQRVFYGDHTHFDKCCNYHDVCYMSCGMRRNACDEALKECLVGSCPRTLDEEHCRKTGNMFYMDRKFYGCTHYRQSQKDLCNCYSPEEAHERVRDYASEFFQVYNKTHTLPSSVEDKYFDREPNSDMHGELILRLYKKYPEGVEIVARDGLATRSGAVYFPDVSDTVGDDRDEL